MTPKEALWFLWGMGVMVFNGYSTYAFVNVLRRSLNGDPGLFPGTNALCAVLLAISVFLFGCGLYAVVHGFLKRSKTKRQRYHFLI